MASTSRPVVPGVAETAVTADRSELEKKVQLLLDMSLRSPFLFVTSINKVEAHDMTIEMILYY